MERQFLSITSLTILQSSKLLGIAENEFDLKAQLVILHNLRWMLLDVGAEQQTRAIG